MIKRKAKQPSQAKPAGYHADKAAKLDAVDKGLGANPASPNFLRGKVAQRIQAKALFMEKGGRISIPAIAKIVGVYSDTVQRWKIDDHWNDELQQHFTNAGIKQGIDLLNLPEVKALCGASEDELQQAVQKMVGGKVTDIITGFMTRIHQQDIRDLDELNQAIRTKLKVIQVLKTADINNLVNAKVNVIKAMRLIFGQSTENNSNDNNDNSTLTLIMPAEAAQALNRLGAYEAEYERMERENDGSTTDEDKEAAN
jgi:hypothetical protein